MEALYLLLISIFFFFFLSLNFILKTQRFKSNLPPYPTTPLPLIGHLHLLKSPLHRKFHSISQSLNNSSIFSLRLGTRLLLIVSSYSIAEECFTKNDVVLANRPEFIIGKYIGYNFTTMVGASYGNHWRNLRKIGSVEIFSSHRLNTFLSVRQDEIQRLIFNIYNNTLKTGYAKMDMSSLFTNLTLNNITRMVAGKRFYGNETDHHDDEAKHVRQLISDVVASSGVGNAADYLPVLRWVTKYEKQVKKLSGRVDKFLQGLVDEIRMKKVKGNTMIDHLLSLQEVEPDYYTDVIIKGIMLVMILAGTDTSAGTLEWAMSNLLNHPEILQKARTEIETKIGLNRLIQESDIPNLPYLQNIVSETLRLYPVAPLLLPHVASQDCSVSSYNMPRGTILLVNVWAIHRDPKVWEEAEKFKPERFEKKGEEQKLMSFGIGRRACPGSGLANRLVSSVIGSLVQCFDWERVGEEFIDMSECRQGTTMRKATSFQAICRVRPIVGKIINNSNP